MVEEGKDQNNLRQSWRLGIEFKKQDCWMGVFWQTQHRDLHIYICILPCLPIHIIRFNHDQKEYK